MKKMAVKDIENIRFSLLSDEEKEQAFAALQAMVLHQVKVIAEKDSIIAELLERRKLQRQSQYDPSSEQMEFCFDEAEAINEPVSSSEVPEEEEKQEVLVRKRKPKKRLASAPAYTPVYDVYEYDVNAAPGEYVNEEGIVMVRGEDRIVEKLTLVPQQVLVERHHYLHYVAKDAESESGNTHTDWGKSPEVARYGVSIPTIAMVAVNKFDDHLPYYRQEEILQRLGISYTRQKMAQHLIGAAQDLEAYDKALRAHVYSASLIHRDETHVTVLDLKNDKGRVATNKYIIASVGVSYTDGSSCPHVVKVYDFANGRGKEFTMDGLRNYKGYVMTDAYEGYNEIPDDRHCVCWTHIVRPFKQKAKSLKNAKSETEKQQRDWLKDLLEGIVSIWSIDSKLRQQLYGGEISREEFLALRKKQSVEAIDKFYKKLEAKRWHYSPKSVIGEAMTYAFNRRDLACNYLECAECTPDNNTCERSIRPFALGRRNYLFFHTLDGCDASCLYYSMIETAKECNINALDYVEYVLRFGLGREKGDPCEDLMPWNYDENRLRAARSAYATARIDETRVDDYVFSGAHR